VGDSVNRPQQDKESVYTMPAKFIINTTDHQIVRNKKGRPMVRFTLTTGLIPEGASEADASLITLAGCLASFGEHDLLTWQGPMVFTGGKYRAIVSFSPKIIDGVLESLEKAGSKKILWTYVCEYREIALSEPKQKPVNLDLPAGTGYVEFK